MCYKLHIFCSANITVGTPGTMIVEGTDEKRTVLFWMRWTRDLDNDAHWSVNVMVNYTHLQIVYWS